MTWYRAGTISVTANSLIVTGTGTAFVANVKPGDALEVTNGVLAEIRSIQSDTQLTLVEPYSGATAAGLSYHIVPTAGYIRDLALRAAALVQYYSDLSGFTGGGTVASSWDAITDKPLTFPPSAHSHIVSDVTGLQAALDGKADAGHVHAWTAITDKPTSFAPSAHTHDWASVTGKPTSFTPSTHTHDWSAITGKPTAFTPSAHGHAATEITGLATVASSGNAADLSGNLPMARLAGGVGASASTFLRGDGSWATPAGGGGGSITEEWVCQTANFTLANSIAVQQAFSPGIITLQPGFYEFRWVAVLSDMSATSGNLLTDVLGAGTAVCSSAIIGVVGGDANNLVTIAGTRSGTMLPAMAITSRVASASTGTFLQMEVFGSFMVNVGGTIIPSVALETAAAAVVRAGSSFRVRRLGATASSTGVS